LAQAAYDFANTIVSDTQIDPYARVTVNSAYAFSNTVNIKVDSAYAFSNVVNIKTDAAYSWANTVNVTAEAAFSKANAANVLAQVAFNSSNVAITAADSANTRAISANTIAYSAYNYANTLGVNVANSLIIVTTAPANNKGAGGDTKGMVHIANNYFYYCTANHDGSTNIWSRIASTDAW